MVYYGSLVTFNYCSRRINYVTTFIVVVNHHMSVVNVENVVNQLRGYSRIRDTHFIRIKSTFLFL